MFLSSSFTYKIEDNLFDAYLWIESVYCVAVSPNGKYAISGSLDKSIKIFDLTTMKDIYHFKDAHKGKLFHQVKTRLIGD